MHKSQVPYVPVCGTCSADERLRASLMLLRLMYADVRQRFWFHDRVKKERGVLADVFVFVDETGHSRARTLERRFVCRCSPRAG